MEYKIKTRNNPLNFVQGTIGEYKSWEKNNNITLPYILHFRGKSEKKWKGGEWTGVLFIDKFILGVSIVINN